MIEKGLMRINQIEKILADGGIELNEAKIEAKMLTKHYLNLSDVDLALNEEFDDEKMREVALKAQLRASKRIPIQHIIGESDFMGERFIVNKNVLIPRDETELLVRKAVEIINNNHFEKVLDIGTGSGCIACMIAKGVNGNAQVLGVDISTDALQIALDNSSRLGLFNKAVFRKSDVFSNVKSDEKFDLIVSNPPYIPLSEKNKLQKEVQFEPQGALFAKNEGLEFYEKIITQARPFLNEGGYLLFELGIGQAQKVKKLMEENNFKDIEIEQDLAYIERVISGKREEERGQSD